jgi:magnesium transporter
MIGLFVYSKAGGFQHGHDPTVISDLLKDESNTLWVDVDTPTDQEIQILTSVFNFHPLAIEDCLSESLLPKLDDFGEYFFLVLHGTRPGESGASFQTVQLHFFVGKRYLVTFHRFPSRSIASARERCYRNHLNLSRGVDFLLHEILDALVDHYFPILDGFDDHIDELERLVFERADSELLNRIFDLRRDVMHLRRVTAPQLEILNRLSRDPHPVIGKKSVHYFRDVYDHMLRIADLTEAYKDLVAGLLEVYLSVVSNRLTEVMKVLTLFSTIMLPLSVITGIFGMNFDYIPGLKWAHGFSLILGLMSAIALGMLIVFKKKKWM